MHTQYEIIINSFNDFGGKENPGLISRLSSKKRKKRKKERERHQEKETREVISLSLLFFMQRQGASWASCPTPRSKLRSCSPGNRPLRDGPWKETQENNNNNKKLKKDVEMNSNQKWSFFECNAHFFVANNPKLVAHGCNQVLVVTHLFSIDGEGKSWVKINFMLAFPFSS